VSNELEAYERDIAWLKSRRESATEADCEMFCDKVALFTGEGLSEAHARSKSFRLLIGSLNDQ
jgi:hypothetical protein